MDHVFKHALNFMQYWKEGEKNWREKNFQCSDYLKEQEPRDEKYFSNQLETQTLKTTKGRKNQELKCLLFIL